MREGLDELEERTKQFAIQAIHLCTALERSPGLREVSWQLSSSAGSVAANHRAMRRARSTREFMAKLQIVNEEVDETVLWLEISQALADPRPPEMSIALKEAIELRSIFARARRTARLRRLNEQIRKEELRQ